MTVAGGELGPSSGQAKEGGELEGELLRPVLASSDSVVETGELEEPACSVDLAPELVL